MIKADRYVKVVLTLIAVELLWLGINGTAPRIEAQAGPTPVVITGIQLDSQTAVLPVALVGSYRQVPGGLNATLEPTAVRISGAVAIDARTPLKVDSNRPLKIEADRPLRVESVPYTPSPSPGD
jgi:hypothetical protein